MHSHYLITLDTQDIDSLSEHLNVYDKDIKVQSCTSRKFDYAKQFCLLGDSFVSISRSNSGWRYETQHESDGFLVSIPQAASIAWRSPYGVIQVPSGEVALLDQRQINKASFHAGVRNITVYIANVDMFRVLSMLLERTPKTRVFFKKQRGGERAARFIVNIVRNIIDFSSDASVPIKGVTKGLKESLIAFILYNFENNYSRALSDMRGAPVPTPYAIKQAAQLMTNTVSSDLTVGEIALKVGISVRSLQLGFKRYKNMTPMAFLRVARLQRSHEILLDPNCTKTPRELAVACGFSNYQLYVRYYLELYGEHPTATTLRYKK